METRFPIIDKARAWYHGRPSEDRKKIKKYGTITVFLLVGLAFYYGSGRNNIKPVVPAKVTPVDSTKDKNLLNDDVVSNLSGRLKDQSEKIDQQVQEAVKKAIANGQFNLPGANDVQSPPNGAQSHIDTGNNNSGQSTNSQALYPGMGQFPPPVQNAAGTSSQPDNGNSSAGAEEKAPEWIGGIGGQDDTGLSATPQESTVKKESIQLPVGFMKSKLLVGVNALTGQYGEDNPQTLMLRVQAPAQLPNFIKMNLRGCFVIANVSGNLSAERITVLPVSMHCMTMDGQYIVEGNVKGFVSDRDGKRDMSGRVVSRAGRLLASTVFAKSLEGFASVIGNQSIQQNSSPLGSVSTIKPGEATNNAAATGVAGGFQEVSKYLLNLAQQTSPAIETGPGKDLMLFIQETAELTIKQVRIK